MEEKRKRNQAIIYKNGNIASPLALIIEGENDIKEIFIKKKNLLDENEQKLYFALKKLYSLNKNIEISIQVALNRILEINENRKDLIKIFNEAINKKSMDFVIWNNLTREIVCCIELNGKSHEKLDRKNRDEYIKEIFKKVNIPIIFLETKKYYDIEEIKRKIKEVA